MSRNVILALLVAFAAFLTSPASQGEVLAVADAEGYVVADVREGETTLLGRPIGGGDEAWRPIRALETPLAAVAVLRGDLALVEADGGWLLIRAGRLVTGPPPPGPLRDVAAVGDTLYATGDAAAFYRFDGQTWEPLPDVPAPDARLVGTADGVIAVAGGEAVRLWQWAGGASDGDVSEGGAWDELPAPQAAGRVLPVALPDAVALVVPGTPGRLLTLRDGAWSAAELAGDARSAEAAVWAGGALRLLGRDEGGNITETVFDADGQPVRAAEALEVRERPDAPPWPNWLVLALLVAVSLAAWQMRPPVVRPATAQVAPAPPGRRLAAAAIDLGVSWLPVTWLLGAAYPVAGATPVATALVALGAGFIVHLAYMLLTEIALGRSPGKLALRLAVVGLDNRLAGRRALWTRNVMRVVDVWPVGLPLLMVLVTPLRQRLGDVTAGTLVVPAATVDRSAPPDTPADADADADNRGDAG